MVAKESAKTGNGTAPEIDQVKDDIAALARDVAALVDRMRVLAGEEAGEAVGDLRDKARHLYENAAAKGEQSVKAVGRQVEERPLLSLLVAFAAGFVVSRFLSR